MRLNEKDQKIKKCEKSILIPVQNIVLVRHPYEKDQQIEKSKKWILVNVWKHFGETQFYLRSIIFKPKYWELSWAIKMEDIIIEKSIIQ